MIKFTQIKKINESEEVKANLPENITEDESIKDKDKSEISEDGPSKLFSKLFESREMAHIYHLQVRGDEGSHASHKALNDYYNGVLEMIDELIEVYQGQYKIVENYDTIDTKATNSKDKIEYFQEIADFIKKERLCINAEDSHLHNIIDEIVALIYKTLYKLKFNK